MVLKRLSAVFLCILMVTVMFPVGAAAAEEEDAGTNIFEENAPKWTSEAPEAAPGDEDAFLRIAGSNRYDTAFKCADQAVDFFGRFDDPVPNFIIASGTDFPDALGAAGPAYELGAPILLVDRYRVKQVAEYIGKYISKDYETEGNVFIMGGTGAVPAAMETELIKAGISEEHIFREAGANRYETNIKVLEDYGKALGSDTIMVCSGKDFADALSASATGCPILLVGDRLTDGQKTLLKNGEAADFCILGGTAAVSTAVEEELKAIAGESGYVERIAGKNRYETSRLMAETWSSGAANAVVLAYGLDFPDGLSGATLCFMNNAPMLLATTTNISEAAAAAKTLGIEHAVVLGGPTLISDAAVLKVLE